MAAIKIAVLNASMVLEDEEIGAAIPALQKQVHEDLAPAWGVDADLQFVPRGVEPPAGYWWLAILDDSDLAGALGYHDLTIEGLPMGKVFARTDQQFGLAWTVTASHELLEMLVDPDISLCAFNATGGNTGTFYAYEVCDPCELDEQGYNVDGVLVSDFVYPAWFEGFRSSGSTTFDHAGYIKDPFGLLAGGYAQLLDIPSGLGWYQVDLPMAGAGESRKLVPNVGTRRERRVRTQWRVSGIGGPPAEGARPRAGQVASEVRRGIWIPTAAAGSGSRFQRVTAVGRMRR